ncbi:MULTISPECIES: glycerol-3-phosphate responsive antiterminator [Sporolactobacillus]|jgi:glycerol uptake operon antiterminator|uniref:Glycerol uptake operon antiterminator regulatory protein n=2 Tax=Sporolactobacillus TaxID=2077 RepID=A0A4Y1ZFZ0_9BACL|nr:MULTISPECIES: glycerol-3-phosphate responsive antiterminator [Sporolactobacillus]QAA23083.1 glycerol-3-phosphate responsive antiterminator [Sporolactobacillus terrae]QAA26055.1 glycerol-3-phosphate responsive antiterminator [Sporolactobacillus terrae]UAK15148.1 glycerol-3-phosphate responsive antiterminator [Sporolactobacillus terrae]BBN99495.1 glycerol uptake operon antiterminator regulatory protein [Sporolactobacillus terrae]GAY77398.1 glycerol uptake operon antiterminator regulatory prot
MLDGQKVVPAANSMKNFEALLRSPFTHLIILDSHLSLIGTMVRMGKQAKKKVFIHADLIQGLKNDQAAAEFICQTIRPYGLISTRGTTLEMGKKRGLVTIQRLFLLDSRSLEVGCRLHEQIKPDMVELLPGVVPELIQEVIGRLGSPVIAGGMIRTRQDAEAALSAGASAISTSRKELWDVRL